MKEFTANSMRERRTATTRRRGLGRSQRPSRGRVARPHRQRPTSRDEPAKVDVASVPSGEPIVHWHVAAVEWPGRRSRGAWHGGLSVLGRRAERPTVAYSEGQSS